MIKKTGGSIKDSYLAEGFILEKSISVGCPHRMENARFIFKQNFIQINLFFRILVANTPMDYDKIKIYGTKVKVDSMDKIAEIEAAECLKMKDKVDKIIAYQPNVFINRQLIYNSQIKE